MEETTQLIEWNRIKAEVANCTDITIMSKTNYSLEAIQKWAKQSNQSLEAQNEIAEYRLRLNRKQGEWIEDNIPEDGWSNLPTKNSQQQITLADVGIGRNDSPKFRILSKILGERFESYITESKEAGNEITTNDACHLFKTAHVSHNSGENEWYTPEIYIEAARGVMGSIDTDPASSDLANQSIKAKRYFTIENDGLVNQWAGNIWMNPPYSQPLITEFCNLLVSKFKNHEIEQACVLVNNATETAFYQNMLSVISAACFLKGRVKFLDKAGNNSGAPLQGQTILYFGGNKILFAEYFNIFGVVLYAG